MRILGISAYYHDAAACLVEDGKIIAAAQEERFTRKKHDASFPKQAIDFCLMQAGIQSRDLDLIAFYDKPFVKFERLLETYLQYSPRGLRSFIKAMPLWIKQKLWIKDLIATKLEFEGKIIFPSHHESHAASAFFASPYQSAAILTADGVGEWATASYGVGEGNRVQLLKEIRFPHSLGLLYSAFTYYTGFRVNSGEYKVMGLAPYGEPKYKNLILDELIDIKEDGSFKLNMKYFDYPAGLRMVNRNFEKLFGAPARKPESKITQREMDLARSVQEVTEEIVMKMAKHIHRETGKQYLCLAGGVALNCVSNGKVLQEGPFKDLWIQPAAGDAGGALGAALFGWFQYLENPRHADNQEDMMQGTYLGPQYDNAEIKRYLESQNFPYEEIAPEKVAERIASLVAQEKVIGWFQGRMEFGPRALGARSIIGDARSPKMQEQMNLKIKFRESFRPFAPSVLENKRSEFFDIEAKSPYMQLVANVKSSHRLPVSEKEEQLEGLEKLQVKRSNIPAITHVDYSARLQTVDRQSNELYYQMIEQFDKAQGCPVIINTSFNVRGEPIVCSPEDAYQCFMRTNMDYLILGNCLLEKIEQKPLDKDIDWLREFELD